MKSLYSSLSVVVALLSGCTPSVSTTPQNFTFLNSRAEYWQNVSTVYGLGDPAAGMTAYDIQWKDSTGKVESLSGYKGKPIVVSFWRNEAPQEAFVLDTVAAMLGDSVKILSMSATSDVVHSFAAVKQFVQSSGIKSQVVIDSGGRVQQAYVVYGNTSIIGVPQTFIVTAKGDENSPVDSLIGVTDLVSLVRAAYH